jgi:hypothetical protein
MSSYTDTIENMRKMVLTYRSLVGLYCQVRTDAGKEILTTGIEDLIAQAAANGMSKDELDELAGTEW